MEEGKEGKGDELFTSSLGRFATQRRSTKEIFATTHENAAEKNIRANESPFYRHKIHNNKR
jgi:hypothetical protein